MFLIHENIDTLMSDMGGKQTLGQFRIGASNLEAE
jgi:hypothetical protein